MLEIFALSGECKLRTLLKNNTSIEETAPLSGFTRGQYIIRVTLGTNSYTRVVEID